MKPPNSIVGCIFLSVVTYLLAIRAEVFFSWDLTRFRRCQGVNNKVRLGAVYLLTFHFGNQTAIPSTHWWALELVTINTATEARWLGFF